MWVSETIRSIALTLTHTTQGGEIISFFHGVKIRIVSKKVWMLRQWILQTKLIYLLMQVHHRTSKPSIISTSIIHISRGIIKWLINSHGSILRPVQSFLQLMMKEYISKNEQLFHRNEQLIQSQESSFRNLEVQMGQLTTDLRSRPLGILLSNTEAPKSDKKEQCKAITLRSGKKIKTTPTVPDTFLLSHPNFNLKKKKKKRMKKQLLSLT